MKKRKKVRIFHFPGRGSKIGQILEGGLKSRAKLIQEGKMEPINTKGIFPDHLSNIYFAWVPRHLKAKLKNLDWVAVDVDPHTTDVYNMEFRAKDDRESYKKSRITLAEYIEQHKKTADMRKNLKPGEMIIWKPFTAEPFVIKADEREKYGSEYQYLNEVLIKMPHLPPDFIKKYHVAKKSQQE
jgi:hypothetical protein